METDPLIWNGALAMVRKDGDDAALRAATHADSCLDRGDLAGRRFWQRMLTAIEWLRADEGAHPFKVSH